mmetsp:Transcript_145212/g.404698  ORF Transcript_145212/g.404698 Transcript_145212/m.404698 type:complete len:233 (+) Transcript_145212:640-1338(+)
MMWTGVRRRHGLPQAGPLTTGRGRRGASRPPGPWTASWTPCEAGTRSSCTTWTGAPLERPVRLPRTGRKHEGAWRPPEPWKASCTMCEFGRRSSCTAWTGAQPEGRLPRRISQLGHPGHVQWHGGYGTRRLRSSTETHGVRQPPHRPHSPKSLAPGSGAREALLPSSLSLRPLRCHGAAPPGLPAVAVLVLSLASRPSGRRLAFRPGRHSASKAGCFGRETTLILLRRAGHL